jgi:hypothetical protein
MFQSNLRGGGNINPYFIKSFCDGAPTTNGYVCTSVLSSGFLIKRYAQPVNPAG